MKILYDHLGFMHKYGGVPKYYVELLKHFNSDIYTLLVLFSNNYYLEESELLRIYHLFSNSHFKGKYTILNILNKCYSIPSLCCGKFDIYHQTLYDTYALKYLPKSKIYVTTMHDLNFVKIPQFYSKRSFFERLLIGPDMLNYQKESALKSDHIIAISHNTKQDLVNEWGIDPCKISVIYHGVSSPLKNLPEKRFHEKPYILYVGTRNLYKNFGNFRKAFFLLSDKNIDLVCTGVPFSSDELLNLSSLHLSERVFCYPASEYDLARLYRDALCFVYPSFYEGFGMPILEAMSYGCPVVLSNTSCFPEIAQKAGLYFDPTEIDDIHEKMKIMTGDVALRHYYIEEGYKRIKSFSWEKCAQQHIEVYKSLL